MVMKIRELMKACLLHDYILVRLKSNRLIGINCKVYDMACKRIKSNIDENSIAESFKPCSFQEYITYKVAFI